jgi:hypothetical protein
VPTGNFKMKSSYADASSQIQAPLSYHGLPEFVVISIVVEHDWHRLRSDAAKRILHIPSPSSCEGGTPLSCHIAVAVSNAKVTSSSSPSP